MSTTPKPENIFSKLDLKTLSPLKQLSTGTAAVADVRADKILLGGAAFLTDDELNTPEGNKSDFRNLMKSAKYAIVNPYYSAGLTSADPAERNTIARVFPFSMNTTDAGEALLNNKLAGIPVTSRYLCNGSTPITRNGRYILNLSNAQVYTAVKNHFAGTPGNPGLFDNCAGAALDDYENSRYAVTGNNDQNLPVTNATHDTHVLANRQMMKELGDALHSKGRKVVIQNLTPNDPVNGVTSIQFAAKSTFCDAIEWRPVYNNSDTNNPLDLYHLNQIRDLYVGFNDNPAFKKNVIVNPTNVSAGNITAENAIKLQTQIANHITDPNLGNPNSGKVMINLGDANLSIANVKQNAAIAYKTRPYSINFGHGGVEYSGAQDANAQALLEKFDLPAVRDNTTKGALNLINPYLLDTTNPADEQRINTLNQYGITAFVRKANGEAYLHEGRYYLPDYTNVQVRNAMLPSFSGYNYGQKITGLGEYNAILANAQNPQGIPTTIVPGNGTTTYQNGGKTTSPSGSAVVILPNSTILPGNTSNGPNPDATTIANQRAASIAYFNQVVNAGLANGQIVEADDVTNGFTNPADAQSLVTAVTTASYNANARVNVDITNAMTDQQIRAKVQTYINAKPGVPLNITVTGMSAINSTTKATLTQKLGTAFAGLQMGPVDVYMAKDGTATDLSANLAVQTANARISAQGADVSADPFELPAQNFEGTKSPKLEPKRQ